MRADKDLVVGALNEAFGATYAPPPGALLHFEETADGKRMPARVERLDEVPGSCVQRLVANLLPMTRARFGVVGVLRPFKTKVNFKFPGGGGYKAHQDTPAYEGFGARHFTVLVPLTEYTELNGTLEVGPDGFKKAVPMDALDKLPYCPLKRLPGELVMFDGWRPHRSGPNRSELPRVGLYITYVNDFATDLTERYYAAKAGAEGLSYKQVDFTGKLVAEPALALNTTIPGMVTERMLRRALVVADGAKDSVGLHAQDFAGNTIRNLANDFADAETCAAFGVAELRPVYSCVLRVHHKQQCAHRTHPFNVAIALTDAEDEGHVVINGTPQIDTAGSVCLFTGDKPFRVSHNASRHTRVVLLLGYV